MRRCSAPRRRTPPETVAFVLKIQDENALSNEVENGMSQYLSVSQFAKQYGASNAYLRQLTSYLGNYGITTNVDGDDIDVDANGTAGEFDQALQTSQKNYSAPATPAGYGHQGHPVPELPWQHQEPVSPAQPRQRRDSDPRPDQLCAVHVRQRSGQLQRGSAQRELDQCLRAADGPAERLPTCPRTSPRTTTSSRCTRMAPRVRARPSASSPSPRSIRAPRSTSGRTSKVSPTRPPTARSPLTTSTAAPERRPMTQARARRISTSSSPAAWPQTPT